MIKIGEINYAIGLDNMCFPTLATYTCKCLGYSDGLYLIETDGGIKMSIDAKYATRFSPNKDEILRMCVAEIKKWENDVRIALGGNKNVKANCEMRRKYPNLFK